MQKMKIRDDLRKILENRCLQGFGYQCEEK